MIIPSLMAYNVFSRSLPTRTSLTPLPSISAMVGTEFVVDGALLLHKSEPEPSHA